MFGTAHLDDLSEVYNSERPDPVGSDFVDLDVVDSAALERLIGLGVPVVGVDSEPDEIGTGWLDNLEHPEFGPVSWLGELPSGGRLMSELEHLPADAVANVYEAVEVVALWDRIEAYCGYRKRLAAAALARMDMMANALAGLEVARRSRGDGSDRPPLGSVAGSVAAAELGMRLGVARRTAQRLIDSGRAFHGVGLAVGESLAQGCIDAAKADMVVSAVEELDPEAALDVQDRVLERAGHLPMAALRRELAAACAGVDTQEYEARCASARLRRRVCPPRVLPHGMAGLYAVLPAVEATTFYRAVDAAARSAKASGDVRTMDQLRADAMAMLAQSALETGWIGTPPEAELPPHREASRQTDTSAETRSCSGEAFAGANSIAIADVLGADADWLPQTDRGGGGDQLAAADRGSGRDQLAAADRGSSRDQLAAADRGGGGDMPGAPVPDGSPSDRPPGRLQPEPGRRGGMRIGHIGGRSAQIRVVVPLTTLMEDLDLAGDAVPNWSSQAAPGLGGHVVDGFVMDGQVAKGDVMDGDVVNSHVVNGDGVNGTGAESGAIDSDPGSVTAARAGSCGAGGGVAGGVVGPVPAPGEPGYLEGYGPIPGSVARAVAAGGVWARLVKDPIDGSIRELSTPRYRPPARMADLVRAEHPYCVRPGCSVPADDADLNHTIPWPVGATQADGLGPLCRPDHNLVTHAGWQVADIHVPEQGGDATASREDGRPPRPNARLWTTTSGHMYLQTRSGTIRMVGDRVVRPAGLAHGQTEEDDSSLTDDPPVRYGHDSWGEPPF